MDDFKKTVKMQCFKDGGSVQTQVSNYTKRSRKVTDAADIAQDKAVVKKAIAIHDKQEHPGEKTDLSKLKKGGRTKKAVGTVRKYKTGGSVDNVYGAKKKSGDLDNIQKTKDIKAAKLCGGGKAVKKMADGGLTGLGAISNVERAAMQNALPGGIGQGSVNDMERRRMMDRAKNAMKYLGPAQQSEFVNQGGMSPTGVAQPPAPAQAAPAGSTIPAGQKRGGKVKKMNTGGTCS
jgi:hypothetical protein